MKYNCIFCRAPTPSSDEDAVAQLRPWVKKKKAWAQEMMGEMYRDGAGVKQSYEMAKRLYELAAQQGYVNAMAHLGDMYAHGEGSVEQSYERAAEYYKQAARLGYATARFNLGSMYDNGLGVEQSYETAAEFYDQATQQGDAGAMNNLGILYAKGQGVERDLIKARELFTTAEALGDTNATAALKNLDDDERKAAALDPNAVVCSMCGLPQTATRSFNKFKCPCKSTRYCNTTCQKKHWKMHRNDCKRLRVELKRKKKERDAEVNKKAE